MLNRIGSALAFLFLLGLVQHSLASSSSATTMQTTIKPKAKAESKDEKSWSAGLQYSLRSDLNQQTERKTNTHDLGFSAGYEVTSSLSLSAGTSIAWRSEGSNIQKKEDNPAWSDLGINLGYGGRLTSTVKYSLSVSDSLPTGYDSRTEGVRNSVSVSGGLSRTFLDKKLSLSGSASASHTAHTYEYSITSGESNSDSSYSAGASLSYKVMDGLSLSARYSAWTTHFINGENRVGLASTSVSANYSTKWFSSFVSYSVGNYDKNDGYRFLHVEDTRQLVTVGVGFDI